MDYQHFTDKMDMLLERREHDISRKDAIEILKDIETGQGRIAEFAQDRPDLVKLSQDSIKKKSKQSGDIIIYRALSLGKDDEVKGEKEVSGSYSLPATVSLSRDTPAKFGGAEAILKYTVPEKNITIDVEDLVNRALEDNPKLKDKKIQGARNKVSTKTIEDATIKEKEVVFNADGLKPEIFKIDTLSKRSALSMLMDNPKITVDEFIKKSREGGNFFGMEVIDGKFTVDEKKGKEEAQSILDAIRGLLPTTL